MGGMEDIANHWKTGVLVVRPLWRQGICACYGEHFGLGERIELIPFAWHSVDERRSDLLVGGDGIETGCALPGQMIHVAQEINVLHLHFHILHKLLISWHLINHKFPIPLITFQHSHYVNLSSLDGKLKVEQVMMQFCCIK